MKTFNHNTINSNFQNIFSVLEKDLLALTTSFQKKIPNFSKRQSSQDNYQSLTPPPASTQTNKSIFTDNIRKPLTLIDVEVSEPIQDNLDYSILDILYEESADSIKFISEELKKLSNQIPIEFEKLQREIHTLKGGVGVVGALRARSLLHVIENRFDYYINKNQKQKLYTEASDLISVFDFVVYLLESIKTKTVPVYPEFSKNIFSWFPENLISCWLQKDKSLTSETPLNNQQKKLTNLSRIIRVKSEALDLLLSYSRSADLFNKGIFKNIEEFYQQIKEFSANTSKLSNLLREFEVQSENQIQARKINLESQGLNFDPLELDRYTRLQEITRFLSEGFKDLNQIKEDFLLIIDDQENKRSKQEQYLKIIQDSLSKTRLVTIDNSFLDRFNRLVRNASLETKKSAIFILKGGDLEIDKSLAEKLTSPLEHIIRNSIAHGIEPKDERIKLNKNPEGVISIVFEQKNNRIICTIKDDGSGLNLTKIKAKAIEKSWLTINDSINNVLAAEIICRPGFSTADQVSEIAGRGVGMDVVRNDILNLGGRFNIISHFGSGLFITLSIPSSLTSVSVMLFKSENQSLAIPTENIVSIKTSKLFLKNNLIKNEVFYLNKQWQILPIGTKLGLKNISKDLNKNNKNQDGLKYFIFIEENNKNIALLVDSIVSVSDFIFKPLGKLWSSESGILGTIIDSEGFVYFLIDVFKIPTIKKRHLISVGYKPKTIMIVDDSITVRLACKEVLKNENYNIVEARDGKEAINFLSNVKPDLILLDIEMPIMDGFEFTRLIKLNNECKDIPIIMVTSRTAEKHRAKAKFLGINDYIGKPFNEIELKEKIGNFLNN